VAELLAKGLENLPKGSMLAMLIGGIVGVIIAILDEFLPKKYVKWVPSATGFGDDEHACEPRRQIRPLVQIVGH